MTTARLNVARTLVSLSPSPTADRPRPTPLIIFVSQSTATFKARGAPGDVAGRVPLDPAAQGRRRPREIEGGGRVQQRVHPARGGEGGAGGQGGGGGAQGGGRLGWLLASAENPPSPTHPHEIVPNRPQSTSDQLSFNRPFSNPRTALSRTPCAPASPPAPTWTPWSGPTPPRTKACTSRVGGLAGRSVAWLLVRV